MSKKRQEQSINVFNIPKDLLEQLEPIEKDTDAVLELHHQEEEEQVVNARALERLQIQEERLANESSDNLLTCSTCSVTLNDRTEQKQHFNTDWHRYNIKRRVVLEVEPVTFEEFETLLVDLTESISGSEVESDDEADDKPRLENLDTLVNKQKLEQEHQEQLADGAKQAVLPFMKKYSALTWFKTNQTDSPHYGIYRHLFTKGYNSLASLQKSNTKRTWTIIMLGGGHFAGCIIDINGSQGNDPSVSIDKQVKLITHKTFHRYTTRRKQGGSQSANDNAKGAANSAGAMIRRHNEQMLQQEVRQVLDQWRQYIIQSDLVLVHAPSGNRKIVYGYEGAVLNSIEHVKSVPFATKRPTLSELRRVYLEMSTVKTVQIDEEAIESYKQKWIEREEKAKRQLEKSTMPASKKTTTVERNVDPLVEKMLSLVRQNKTTVTCAFLEKHMNLPVSGRLPEELADSEDLYHYPTLLHLVASLGDTADLIKKLLLDFDADPTIVSEAGKTAYEVCKDKEARNAFRRCMCDHPNKWEWLEKGRVPSPLTEKQEQDQIAKDKKKQAKEKEKKRLLELERAKIEAAREAKEEQERLDKLNATRAKNNLMPIVKTLGGDNLTNTANMSPEARMRLEREKRARAAEERMKKK